MVMERTASHQRIGIQCAWSAGSAPQTMRRSTAKAAALGPVDMSATTGDRRAFIDIRRPDMERRGGDFEAEADDDHGKADVEERVRLSAGDGMGDRGGDVVDARGAGGSKDERDAVKEETRWRRSRGGST